MQDTRYYEILDADNWRRWSAHERAVLVRLEEQGDAPEPSTIASSVGAEQPLVGFDKFQITDSDTPL